ncbi:glycoprotein endo-alpha-1,2-mannosidase-like protein [Corythoichthys intestinalis]|uniref:glycoprotein endo-alpha-1,2-mannosidase-like protein n=1 Tax=Corythoichthys intestinalis TaxID=161448 RepID=UPI0025A5C622|nr:glycoprotein endo-alpha-1,2-mannosidase-like protein [Corythoichthys intestinalis]XP_061789888.1 glycoprotein endo-alpha-1,2-mannosidase-like protein [Nerophis lumbriciformis]
MGRLRRRACVALFLFTLFIFGAMMALRTLKTGDGFSDLLPDTPQRRSVQRSSSSSSPARQRTNAAAAPNVGPEGSIFDDVHIFYYVWYGTPRADGKFIHWDHVLVPHWDPKIASSYPRGRHVPPEDIGSSFYPELGPYSSRDPDVLESHMEQIAASAAGVLVLSWYPPGMADDNGEPTEDFVPAILDAAYRHNLKVAFHLQPYRGRNEQSVLENVKYIIDRYGDHAAFYRFMSSTGKSLPLFYIYDSYLTPPESWSQLLSAGGARSLRGSAYDGVFVALIVEERHKQDIASGGFDGMYTYFASNGFSFGSSHQNWKALKAFCDDNELLFVPCVGPGYVDTSVRPWNGHSTRNRVNGRYYETALQAALDARPELLAITSFNEWHEGTQIERAVPKKTAARVYLDYRPHGPQHYLELTRRWGEKFNKEKETWLM